VQALISTIPNATFLEASSITQLETVLAEHPQSDLLLLDLHMPGANGYVGLAHITQNYPQLPVVMISANESLSTAVNAKQYGALGFIPKSASIPEISQNLQQVLQGGTCFPDGVLNYNRTTDTETEVLIKKVAELTPKQLEVFTLLANGLLNKQIAYEQKVTEATIKAHVTAIMRKLSVNNRTQVVLIASKINIVESFDSEIL